MLLRLYGSRVVDRFSGACALRNWVIYANTESRLKGVKEFSRLVGTAPLVGSHRATTTNTVVTSQTEMKHRQM
jgi:hypothetical protein